MDNCGKKIEKVCEMCNYYYNGSYIDSDYPDFCKKCVEIQKKYETKYNSYQYINLLKYEIEKIEDKIKYYTSKYHHISGGYDINMEIKISECEILKQLYEKEIETLSQLKNFGKIDKKKLKIITKYK